ncbi:hypothetical protein [Zymobacter sp. IVIA_12111.31 C1]|uniref:hypothetical protein n=1 Tax=Zymobacter sp. IVIA_12111.31 C1 TaxID=3394854 RepID=UPI0039C232F9
MKNILAISLIVITALLSGCSGAKGDIQKTLGSFFNGIKNQNSTQVVNAIDVPASLQSDAGSVVQNHMRQFSKVEDYEVENVIFSDDSESANVNVKIKFHSRESTLPVNMHKTADGWKLDINQRF